MALAPNDAGFSGGPMLSGLGLGGAAGPTGGYASPEILKSAILAALKRKNAPFPEIKHKTQGWAALANAVADNMELSRLNDQYKRGTASAAFVPSIPGMGDGSSPAAPRSPTSSPMGGLSDAGDDLGAGTSPTAMGGGASPSGGLVDFIKEKEGYSESAYADGPQHSIGWGTKASSPDEKIDRATAEERLNTELGKSAQSVEDFAPGAPAGVKQALTDLTYNTGTKWQGSGLGNAIKSGDYDAAKQIFLQYSNVNGKYNPGVAARRAQAAEWFDNPLPSTEAALAPAAGPVQPVAQLPGGGPMSKTGAMLAALGPGAPMPSGIPGSGPGELSALAPAEMPNQNPLANMPMGPAALATPAPAAPAALAPAAAAKPLQAPAKVAQGAPEINYAQPQVGTFVDPKMIPARPQISQEQMQALLANQYADPKMKELYFGMYMQQGQPIEMKVGGGTVRIDPRNPRSQMWVPDLEKSSEKVGGIDRQVFKVIGPDGKVHVLPTAGAEGTAGMGDMLKLEQEQKGAVKQAEGEGEEFGKARAKAVSEYIGRGDQAQDANRNIAAIKGALALPGAEKMVTGKAGESTMELGKTIEGLTGVKIPGTDPAQVIEKSGTALGIHVAKTLTNRPTQFDFMKILQSVPGLGMTVDGMKMMTDLMEQSNKADIALSKKAFQARKTGEYENWPDVVGDYYKTNPIVLHYKGKTYNTDDDLISNINKTAGDSKAVGSKLPQPPPSKVFGGKTYYQIGGDWYDNPEGK